MCREEHMAILFPIVLDQSEESMNEKREFFSSLF